MQDLLKPEQSEESSMESPSAAGESSSTLTARMQTSPSRKDIRLQVHQCLDLLVSYESYYEVVISIILLFRHSGSGRA